MEPPVTPPPGHEFSIVDRAILHAKTARRVTRQYGLHPTRSVRRIDERMVFIVGSPRSGTSFTARCIGAVTGFADLGEVNTIKAHIPFLYQATDTNEEYVVKRLRHLLVTSQRVGMVAGLRCIEQTPESTYLIPQLARAFPHARFIHLLRDGRDVACSLKERGWLKTGTAGRAVATDGNRHDDAGQPFGSWTRFWVERDRAEEFQQAGEITRAAWAWRRYVTTAKAHLRDLPDRRVHTIRYEQMATDPASIARRLAAFLDATDRTTEFTAAISEVHDSSIGRYRTDLTVDEQRQFIEEADSLLTQLGYKE